MKKPVLFAAALATTGCVLAPLPAEAFGLGGLIQTVIGAPLAMPHTHAQGKAEQPNTSPQNAQGCESPLEIGDGGSLIVDGGVDIETETQTVNGITECETKVYLGGKEGAEEFEGLWDKETGAMNEKGLEWSKEKAKGGVSKLAAVTALEKISLPQELGLKMVNQDGFHPIIMGEVELHRTDALEKIINSLQRQGFQLASSTDFQATDDAHRSGSNISMQNHANELLDISASEYSEVSTWVTIRLVSDQSEVMHIQEGRRLSSF